MKNLIKFLLLMMAVLLPATVSAYDFEVNGIYYNINGNEATVTYHYDHYNYGEEYGEEYYNIYSDYSGNVTIPTYVTYNGKSYPVTAIGNSAFLYCDSLTNVTIPNSVTTIDDNAFCGCSSLNNITIPNSITHIGIEAFRECTSFTSITIPNSVTSIGAMAFVLCERLTNINIPNSLTTISFGTFTACINLTDIMIPSSVTTIEDYAFSECPSLTSIFIPKSITNIGYGVFRTCINLTNMIVESDNTVYDSRNNCNAIIETASNTLIAGCQSTIIPNTVTGIGSSAFESCTELTSIHIPNSINHIGYSAFLDCRSLKDVYSYIVDPLSVTMGEIVFYHYDYLYDDRTLHVPMGSADAYQADSRWSDYFGNIVEMEIVIPATAIELDISEIEITTGETLQLRAIVLPEDATNKAVTWASSDANIARVDGNGLVTALAAGSATITATTVDGSELSASCTITVKPQTPTMNGDVNGDGTVSITDVTDLINLLLTRDD